MAKDKIAVAFEIVDHGLKHSQYFQGCGTAFTDFTDVATGIGDTFTEALDDALESLAQGEWNVDIVRADPGSDDGTSAAAEDDSEESELHYHVSVRVREYDPQCDDPHMLLAAAAIERLAELDIDIHNAQTPSGDPKNLQRMRSERDWLEGWLKEHEVELDKTGNLFTR